MNIHLVAICGTGMGSLAGLLKEAGHQVKGSDKMFYPPMSESLRAWGIDTMNGFDSSHVTGDLDLVVVGNACRKDNPEVQAARDRNIRVASFPETLYELFIKERRSIVVAGTHGKTTTTSMLSYVLRRVGKDPSFLIGGIPRDTGKSFHLGRGELFVVEGDEYDSAFFDKRPKFMHYQPEILVLTSMEYDHADIYPDFETYRNAFLQLISHLDKRCVLVACHDDAEVRSLMHQADCRVVSYGFDPDATWQASQCSDGEKGAKFRLSLDGFHRGSVAIPLSGKHNISNTLAVLAVCELLGIPTDNVASVLQGFMGVARRMQVRNVVAGVTIIDDFAHHPTEVSATLQAARARFPQARLVAVFEPRSNSSRRNVFQDLYKKAFEPADDVLMVPPFNRDQIDPKQRIDPEKIVQSLLKRGKSAWFCDDARQVVDRLVCELKTDSVVVIMSNGDFDGIHEKLIRALHQREDSVS